MGLFDFIKKEAMKAVKDAVEDVVSDVVGNSNGNPRTSTGNHMDYNYANQGCQNNNYGLSGEQLLRSRLETAFTNEWSEYEVRREVPASEMMAETGARNYSYGIYWGGVPKAMIMVLDNRNLYKKKEVRDAQKACQTQGVAYMNFMTHLPNTEEYILQRLRENIR